MNIKGIEIDTVKMVEIGQFKVTEFRNIKINSNYGEFAIIKRIEFNAFKK